MTNRLTEFIENAKKWSSKELEAYRYTLFFAVVVDLGLIYWFLEYKKLGIALMMVIIMMLGFILYLEQQKGGNKKKKMSEEKDKKKKEKKESEKEEDEEKEEENDSFFPNTGLPNAEEYNKRIEKAIGI